MPRKMTYDQLEQRIKDLEQEVTEQRAISEILYKALGTTNATIWYWNIKTDAISTDPRFIDVLEYEAGELEETLQGLQRFHDPKEWDEIQGLLQAHIRGETDVYIHENRILAKTGEWKWVFTRGRVVTEDNHGNPELFIAATIDITKRKQTEDELRRHRDHLEELVKERTARLAIVNEQLKALLNATSDIAVLQDLKGKIVALNTVTASRADRTIEQALGCNVYNILSPTLAKHRKLKVSQVVESGKPCRFQEKHDRIIFDTMMYPIFDGKGKIVQLAVYAKDITEQVKAYKELRKREAELEIKTNDLEKTNAALTVLLKKREEDKAELEQKVLANMKKLIEPYLEELKNSGLNDGQTTYFNILESNLDEIISPFSYKLSSKFFNFTPTEIRVANLVKEGKTTKEIAQLFKISHKTVGFHRENIRKKLGIKKEKANLRSHLLTV